MRYVSRSHWPRGLRRGTAAARVLRLWVRIPPEGIDVCLLWVLYVLAGRGLCDELITLLEESYRLWCIVMCDLQSRNLVNEEALAHWGLSRKKINIPYVINKILNKSACFESQNLRLSSITIIFLHTFLYWLSLSSFGLSCCPSAFLTSLVCVK